MPEVLSYRALCSVADVAGMMNMTSAQQTNHTDSLTRLINAASTAIHNYTNREFVSFTDYANPSATETRKFDVSLYGLDWNTIGVGDMQVAPTTVVIRDWNGNAVTTPNVATDVDCFPRIRQEWQPITMMRFRNGNSIGYYMGAPNAHWPYGDYYVEVTSRWGFPAIPEDIRNAAIETVRFWWDQIFTHSSNAEPDANASQPLRALPPHVITTLNGWRSLRG